MIGTEQLVIRTEQLMIDKSNWFMIGTKHMVSRTEL